MSEPQLSESQRTCLRLVGAGMSSKEIALETGLSPQTIDQYLRRAAVTLGASNRREAARLLADLEKEGFRKSELKPQDIAANQNPSDLSADITTQGATAWRSWPAKWLPPIGGERYDLDQAGKVYAVLRVSLFTVVTAGIVIATFAWLNSIFA
ncbi:MAG TPA: helix-turn-helix transcriptional regulator [Sphingobium sp.]|uniref:helix-turn-helix domain-containing protein n=1 Tax=Sphingobium sp. TaxID=1912891 RepID=UPI002ED0D3CF